MNPQERIPGANDRKRIPGELLPKAVMEGSWIGGKGSKGLESAEGLWQREMNSRTGQGKDPWVIEGSIGGEVVFRRHSIDGNVPEDFNSIPPGKTEEVNYNVIAYKIAER